MREKDIEDVHRSIVFADRTYLQVQLDKSNQIKSRETLMSRYKYLFNWKYNIIFRFSR